MYTKLKWILGILGCILLMILDGFFIVNQTHQTIVLQFGEFIRGYKDPGLKFKVPFLQTVVHYDKRVLGYDLPPISVTLIDQKRLVVDTYTRYRISDPLTFYRAIQPANETGTRLRLEAVVSSSVRNVLGRSTLAKMLSTERSAIMREIEKEVSQKAKPWGIEIVDVRIIRTELPSENRQAIFNRMNAELDRYAKENRAKGDEIAQKTRAHADRKKVVLLAEAERDAKLLEAKGAAEAIEIATKAYSKDKEFYEVFRILNLGEQSLTSNSELIISSEGPMGEIIKKIFSSKS